MTWRDLLFILLLLFCFGLGIYLAIYVNSESYKCMSNSGKYTIVNLEKVNTSNITCTCISIGKYSSASFGIDNTGIYQIATRDAYVGPILLWNTTQK